MVQSSFSQTNSEPNKRQIKDTTARVPTQKGEFSVSDCVERPHYRKAEPKLFRRDYLASLHLVDVSYIFSFSFVI